MKKREKRKKLKQIWRRKLPSRLKSKLRKICMLIRNNQVNKILVA